MSYDTDFDKVSLLLHFDGADNSATVTDSSGVPKTISVNGGVKISTSQSRFGGSSAYFDGTAGSLDVANNAAFGFSTGDFTIELWLHGTFSGIQPIIEARTINNAQPFWFGLTGTTPRVYDGTTLRTGGSITNGQWNHLAWTCSEGSNTVWANGKSAISWTSSIDLLSSRPLKIGRDYDGVNFIGYLDELRITKGVARYTANFTPPTEAFPSRSPNLLVSGEAKFTDGAVASKLRAWRRDTGVLIADVTPNPDGTFSFVPPTMAPLDLALFKDGYRPLGIGPVIIRDKG